jgi:hypothetical protein
VRDDDDITLLSELLPLPSSASDLNLSPQRKREKQFESLLNQAGTNERPIFVARLYQPKTVILLEERVFS